MDTFYRHTEHCARGKIVHTGCFMCWKKTTATCPTLHRQCCTVWFKKYQFPEKQREKRTIFTLLCANCTNFMSQDAKLKRAPSTICTANNKTTKTVLY